MRGFLELTKLVQNIGIPCCKRELWVEYWNTDGLSKLKEALYVLYFWLCLILSNNFEIQIRNWCIRQSNKGSSCAWRELLEYFIKALGPKGQSYSTYETELMAVVEAIKTQKMVILYWSETIHNQNKSSS